MLNEVKHNKLTVKDELTFKSDLNTISIMNIKKVLSKIFMFNYNNDDWKAFLDEYEFIYDKKRQFLLLIVRNTRLRLRKYLYLPPLYVVFPLHNSASWDIESQKHRFIQKCNHNGILREESKERAYYLEKMPYKTAYHPHIDAGGHACWGQWSENLKTAKDQSPYAYCETLKAFLSDYNGRSPFFRISPYHYDRKNDSDYALVFPHYHTNLCYNGTTGANNALDLLLNTMLGSSWMLDLCEKLKLNYTVYNSLWIYLLSTPEENTIKNYESYLCELFINNGIDIGFSKPVTHPSEIPNRRNLPEDDYRKLYEKHDEWRKAISPYLPSGISKYIYMYVYKIIGYELSLGEVKEIEDYATVKFDINYENYKPEKLHELKELRKRNYTWQPMLNNFGNLDSFVDIDKRFKMLLLLYKAGSLTNMYRRFNEFILSLTVQKEKQLELKEYNRIKYYMNHESSYATLKSQDMLPETIYVEFNNDQISIGSSEASYLYHYKEHQKDNLLIELLFEIRTEYYNVSRMEHEKFKTKDVFSFIETLNIDFKWNKNKTNKAINEKDIFYKCFRKILSRGGFSLLTVKAQKTLVKMLKGLSKDKIYKNGNDLDYQMIATDILKGLKPRTDLSIEQRIGLSKSLISYIYKIIPSFPKEAEDFKDIIYNIDKGHLASSYKQYIKEQHQTIKEVQDVLNNTISCPQQGELFHKEVPIN